MSKKQWYFAAQALFSKWIQEQGLSKSCLTQNIGLNKLVETYEVWPESGGMPTHVTFQADRITATYFTAYVIKDNKQIDLNINS